MRSLVLALGVITPLSGAAATDTDVVLITIDTIRADALSPWGGRAGLAPHLERLAVSGAFIERAISPAPLTLPAHASLLTGLEPPRHGLRDNGVGALPVGIPTLASALAAAGWDTAAAVGSRVLDRRFGLDRGFARYDDGAPAERLGEYGYPERDAIATTDAALAVAGQRAAGKPLFLWVHYYDPHAPYQPADGSGSLDQRASWLREIAVVDREIGRLLAGLGDRERLVAVVGDHGEAFGEHGEDGHGLLLHEATLRVPLLFSGSKVPVGRTIAGTYGSVRLPATLLALLGQPALPGSAPPIPMGKSGDQRPVLSETWLPWTAWGWSPLQAVTDGNWRLILGPRPRLFDLAQDPAESADQHNEQRRVARRLEQALAELDDPGSRRSAAPGADGEMASALRSLGYVGAGSGRRPERLDVRALARSGLRDPFDGPRLLAEHERAKSLLATSAIGEARAILDRLIASSPASVPFLSTRSSARAAAGDQAGALADLDAALVHAPALDFLHLSRGQLLAQMGRLQDAEAAWATALELNPRMVPAWLSLAESAAKAGHSERERSLLERAVDVGTHSAALHLRLAQLDLAAGRPAAGLTHARTATSIAPGWSLAWRIRAECAVKAGQPEDAANSRSRAVALDSRR